MRRTTKKERNERVVIYVPEKLIVTMEKNNNINNNKCTVPYIVVRFFQHRPRWEPNLKSQYLRSPTQTQTGSQAIIIIVI